MTNSSLLEIFTIVVLACILRLTSSLHDISKSRVKLNDKLAGKVAAERLSLVLGLGIPAPEIKELEEKGTL